MPREYFPSKFHLDNRTRYFLWSSDDTVEGDQDEVWTRDGIAPTFATLSQVETFAREEVGVSLAQEGEPGSHDLTFVASWLGLSKQRRARVIHARKDLEAWNIFSDLARSLKAPFVGDSRELNELWMLLFWGDPRKIGHYPRWSGAQLQTLHNVLDEGLKLWRAHVR